MSNDQELLRIGVLHYHFMRAGVRTVMINSMKALIKHGPYRCLEIDLISSDAEGSMGGEVSEELTVFGREIAGAAISIRGLGLPELGYNSKSAVNRGQFFAEAQLLTEKLLLGMDLNRSSEQNPYILHVHNGNLGKNPRVTLALKMLADRLEKDNLPGWIIYQMHDFAEDNRPACWEALCKCSGVNDKALAVEMMYPGSSRIQWVTINSKDREKLVSTGLDPERIEVLPNSIDIDRLSEPALAEMSFEELMQLGLKSMDFAGDLKSRIAEFATRNGYRFEPVRKILVSPVKAIRRKNIFESILLLMALNARQDDYQLLVTQAPNSELDLEYYQVLEEFVKNYRLPVLMGFGGELLKGGHSRVIADGQVECYSLIDLIQLSEAVVTTSIQEGFGYAFHESWLMGRAVVGRNILSVTQDFVGQGLKLSHLYDHLLFPKSWLGNRWDNLVKIYYEKIEKLHQSAGFEIEDGKELENRINRQKTYKRHNPNGGVEEYLDWADLGIEMQLTVLKELAEEPDLLTDLIWTNESLEGLSDWFISGKSDRIEANREMVSSKYNLVATADRLSRLIERGRKAEIDAVSEQSVRLFSNEEIFSQSLEVKNIRLLI
ncbi:MAG: glycosyltransferase family 4 protein [Planctomycetes bacterium]|nr:glycosyltransferase family 4 protein [Planctomycetota bacterium]